MWEIYPSRVPGAQGYTVLHPDKDTRRDEKKKMTEEIVTALEEEFPDSKGAIKKSITLDLARCDHLLRLRNADEVEATRAPTSRLLRSSIV